MYDVQCENGEYEKNGVRTDFKKEAQRFSKMDRYFSRSTLQAALFPLGSLTTLGRRGGGIGFLVHCRKEDLVCTRNEYMYVVSKVLLSLNTGQ